MGKSESLDKKSIEAIEGWPLFDNAIVEHHFTPFMRDYDIIVEAVATGPDGLRSYPEGRYRYRFTHCVSARIATTVGDAGWIGSWAREFIDYSTWEAAGAPAGYVWGVNYMQAYPGGHYVRDSQIAAQWARRLGRPMHEVQVNTNAHLIDLVFHRVVLHRIANGDPETRVLSPIEPVEIIGDAG